MTSLIFDLDNTLYPRSPEVEADFAGRIKNYLKNNLSVDFDHSGFDWEKASLNMGAFLDRIFLGKDKERRKFTHYICDVDVGSLQPDPQLDNHLGCLPHDKYIFTDSTVKHVTDSLNQIGVDQRHFKGIFDHIASGFRFKTDRLCHQRFLEKYGLNPEECVLFEDNPHNLCPAAELGMTTVLITAVPRQNIAADYQFPCLCTALDAMF